MLLLLHPLHIALIPLLDDLGLTFASRRQSLFLALCFNFANNLGVPCLELFVVLERSQEILVPFKLLAGHNLNLLHHLDKFGIDFYATTALLCHCCPR